ncbi:MULTISPECIES: hypothetical protein [unclassified Micromonospora]|uniref:hypothetical protein n=1 Tax=unclassified Micromonospora TaxID=2617518 RepID=UPI0033282057
MSAPTRAQVNDWWRILAEHQQRDGRCPRCGTRGRCWERAAALAELIAHDVYHLGPPLTPATSTGGNPTAGQPEGEVP